jgi:hypothetical protein
MSTVPQMSTNPFGPANPMVGDVSESITASGILAGVLTAGSAKAGDRVKLDSTITIPGYIGFVPAADDEAAFGVIKRTAKNTSYKSVAAGGDETTNKVEVVFSGGQCVYQPSGATLTPGTLVAKAAGFLAAVDGTHLQMGLLIDYVVQSSIGRVIIGWVAS